MSSVGQSGSRLAGALDWDSFRIALRRRQVGAVRAALVDTAIDVGRLDEQVGSITVDEPRPEATAALADAFRAVGRPEEAPLVATYLYATALEIWERTSDWGRIGAIVSAAQDALAEVADEIAARQPTELELTRLMLQLAGSILPAMEVENALNCSCPIGMRRAAEQVVEQSADLLGSLDRLPPGHEALRHLLAERALVDQSYFTAILAVADGVEAYIDGGHEASGAIRRAIAQVWGAEHSTILDGDVYESELHTHRLGLEALEQAWPRVVVDSAKVIYCYPFAFRGMTPRKLIAAITAQPVSWTLLGEQASWQKLALSDMWDGTAREHARFAGIGITLPPITVVTTADEALGGFDVEIRVSQLGNHYVRIEHWLEGATVHDLNQAMRRGSSQMGAEDVHFGQQRRARLAELADDLIEALADAVGVGDRPEVVLPGTSQHVIVAARRLSLEGPDGVRFEADIHRVSKAPGAKLLFHPVHQASIALEEWARYPGIDMVGRNLLEGHGFMGDFAIRTANTSFALLPGMPEFMVRDHEEGAEFVASLPALLQSWLDEIHDKTPNLEDRNDLSLAEINRQKLELRKVLVGARTMLADLRSPGLCLTAVQRARLDRLFDSAGIRRLEHELQVQFEVADANYAELSGRQAIKDAERADNADRRQDIISYRLAVATALFGAASIAGVFQLFNANLNPSLAVIVAECVTLVAGATGVGIWLWRRGRTLGRVQPDPAAERQR